MSNYLETDFFFSLKTVSLMVRVNICWFHMCPFFPTSLLGFEHTWPWDFWSSESKKSACSARDPGSVPGLGDPLEKEMALLAILNLGLPRWLSGKESAWVVGDLGWSLNQEDPLEKRLATHSSILAWRIPWTEEPGGLLVCPLGHKESDTTEQLTYTHNLLKLQNGLVHSKQK